MRRYRDPVPGRAVPGRGPDAVGVPGKTTRVMTSPTAPLAAALRARLEAALATDLSAVRVGEDAGVAAIGARAHASGTEIVFAPGAYQPETADGQALIAHEVVHLVQQAAGRVAPDATVAGTPVNTDRGLEQEADQLGARALRGEPVWASGPSLQPSTGTIQGFFGDLGAVFDPLVDAATEWWDELTDDEPSAGGSGGSIKLRVGDVATVTDPDARVRDPAAGWATTGAVIPPGTVVTVMAIDGKHVQVTGIDGTEWGWTRKTNFGGSKGQGPDPAGPEEPVKPPPVLPASDDEWQDLITESRDNVNVTTNYTVATRALNPALLVAIRYSHLDKLDDFYDVLTQKKEKTKGKTGAELTPGRLAYRLGSELVEEAAAADARPTLLAAKLALIDKVAPDGTIDIKKSAGGNLRTALGKGLDNKPAQATINDWIKSHYKGNRLTLTALEVNELRTVVMNAVTAATTDPARAARIEQLRVDIVSCEARVRAVLRGRTATTDVKKQALWSQLADIAETDGVFVDRMLTSYSIEHEDGTVTTLEPALAISVNYLNPGGFKNGGGKYSDRTIDSVLDDVYAGDPDAAAKSDATKKFIHTLNRNEGGPASMNTWDGEIVTGGPGLSGSGRLQKSMFEYKAEDPGGFHDALGKFGVDIQRSSAKSNPFFSVRVPSNIDKIPPSLRDTITPGQLIVGSSRTGAKKSSDSYEECAALRYISLDPVLMSRFMFAGQHSYQRFLLKEAAASMQKAGAFSFLVPDGTPTGFRVNWQALISPLGADWLAATQAVIAYRYHASSGAYEKLKVKAANFYISTIGTDRLPEDLTDEERKTIGRFVAWQLKPGKYKVYREQFPSVASEVFPPAPAKDDKKGKGKGKGKGKTEDVDKDVEDDADVIILDDEDGNEDTDDE